MAQLLFVEKNQFFPTDVPAEFPILASTMRRRRADEADAIAIVKDELHPTSVFILASVMIVICGFDHLSKFSTTLALIAAVGLIVLLYFICSRVDTRGPGSHRVV